MALVTLDSGPGLNQPSHSWMVGPTRIHTRRLAPIGAGAPESLRPGFSCPEETQHRST